MEKDVELGKVGMLKLELNAGKAIVSVSVKESVLEGSVSGVADLSVTVSSSVLLDLLFAAIEEKSPSGAVAIEEGVKKMLKSAVEAIQ